ncbi:ArsS family sensor histidine kinase [Helicobacter mesocricetorum]|uniref:ArsS family sensor histidine kinase n=1 Tax=Helicobacter mesocricetorum TaxID=87012 RepID=UPI000CF06B2C|nr:ArsS family sensor histidine kinase [Helicobacter mesocricetorum]
MINSIFVKIIILFVIAIVGLGAFSYYFVHKEIEKEMQVNQLKYTQFLATIHQLVRFGGDVDLIEKYLDELDLEIIKDSKILEDFQMYLTPYLDNGVLAKIIKKKNNVYLLVQTPGEWKLYGEFHMNKLFNYYILIFVAFFIVVFLFVLVIRSILPLKTLRKEIRKFANGQMDISCKIYQNNEIGELAREFDNAVQKINALNESRHLFLRAIMHELKTPITKGRITAEMIDNAMYKERLCSVFERLNLLINEFAKIEELSSRNYCLNKQDYQLSEILNQVFTMLLLDKGQVEELFVLPKGDFILYVDLEIIALAIKNLIDNALKYKSKGKVEVIVEGRDLIIKNYAPPLPYSLKDLSKPFFKDKESDQRGGLGLGIYIIQSVLDTQGLELEYFHWNNKNNFIIKSVVSQEIVLKRK